MILVPSILSDSLEKIQLQVERVKQETALDRVQIDIVDPEFSDEITIHPIDLLNIDLQELFVDFHLMTNDPINDVVECAQIPGAATIIGQIERMPSQVAFFEHVVSFHLQVGMSLDIGTPIEEIETSLLEKLFLIQVMGNKAGRQGQTFLANVALEKIKTLTKLREENKLGFLIGVDIGMSPENAKMCVHAGADYIAPGSYLWNASDLHAAIEAYL